jgi:hypothetical protein
MNYRNTLFTSIVLILGISGKLFSQTSSKVYSEANEYLEKFDTQKETLGIINDDYKNGKNLISDYYNLVYKAIEEDKPELFDEAIAKAKQAKTLLGHAYTKEKAYQGMHPEAYSPLTLKERKHWLSLADDLISGSHIKNLQAIVKASRVNEANTHKINSMPKEGNFWVYGYTEECGGFYDMKDCGANPVCLKIRFCVISESSETITITAEIQPKNKSECFGSSNNDAIEIYYGGYKAVIPRSEFKLNGYKTKEFTINKSIPFGDGYIIWNREDMMFELENNYPTNGTKTTGGVVIDVDC